MACAVFALGYYGGTFRHPVSYSLYKHSMVISGFPCQYILIYNMILYRGIVTLCLTSLLMNI